MQLFPRVGWLHMQNRPDHMSCYYTYFPLALLPLEERALGVDSCSTSRPRPPHCSPHGAFPRDWLTTRTASTPHFPGIIVTDEHSLRGTCQLVNGAMGPVLQLSSSGLDSIDVPIATNK